MKSPFLILWQAVLLVYGTFNVTVNVLVLTDT